MKNKPHISVVAFPIFLKALKRLNKKYPNVADDLRDLTDQLEAGQTPGDQIQGLKYTVYKARLRNRAASRGKSGGFRGECQEVCVNELQVIQTISDPRTEWRADSRSAAS